MKKYFPEIGDVVLDNGIAMIVVDIENHENIGNCSYDRKYLLCERDFIDDFNGIESIDNILQHGRWVQVIGTEFPVIEKCKDYAPYEIKPVGAYHFRQKTAKTVIIYE